MGLFHIRLGPNKVSFIGLVQPLLDAFKLLSKQSITPLHSNKFVYNISPIFALSLSLFVWGFSFTIFSFSSGCMSFLMFFCVGSFMIFSVLMAGWSSNSKYRLIGSLRSVAQSISYESVFTTLLVLVLFMVRSFRIKSFYSQSSVLYLFFLPVWFVCSLAETHRAPFDFSESESELVSGFNTEYSGAYFAFIFLSEYSMLLFSSILIVWLFFGYLTSLSYFIVVSLSLLITFIFIWVRITFCRFRYDKLMMMSWKILLPSSMFIFILYFGIFLIVWALFSFLGIFVLLVFYPSRSAYIFCCLLCCYFSFLRIVFSLFCCSIRGVQIHDFYGFF